MIKRNWGLLFVLILINSFPLKAQGPPITTDKPIMLGSKTVVLKTLTEIRTSEQGTFVKAPAMVHYLISSKMLVSTHIPLVSQQLKGQESDWSLGDLELMFKYQFYRKDKTGKTFRVVAKTLQKLPTGKQFVDFDISSGTYQSYVAVVSGYETLKHGISNEIGYNFVPSESLDELRYKLGFGLPLLKPVYPVNQLNLYFEYQNNWFLGSGRLECLYAQGIQYAKKRLTVEAALQLPLYQNVQFRSQRLYSIFLGTRYIF